MLVFLAVAWVETRRWRPSRAGTASNATPVEEPSTNKIGLFKPVDVGFEKIGADLGRLVGVNTPEVQLDRMVGSEKIGAISMVFPLCEDLSLLQDHYPDLFNS
jgi:hypothetical protein